MPFESQISLAEIIFAGNSEMAARMRSHDWSNTPLGPVEDWSPTLRISVSTMLASRLAQGVYWGEDYIQLYNDAMIAIYGPNHPEALGQPLRETWSEIWDNQLQPMCEGISNTGEAVFAENQLYHLFRFGYLEETYFTLCYSPIRDEVGKISGIFCTLTETTQQVISQRRLTMLRELATVGSGAKTRQSVYLSAAETFNLYDIPFALFYQVKPPGNLAELVALRGLPPDSTAAPQTIALTATDAPDLTEQDCGWPLAEVWQSREPRLITDVIDRFGSLSIEPWPESPHSAFVLPILTSNKEQVECLLVVGISPRLQFNLEYRLFLELMAQQVENSIVTARSYEADRQQAEILAELDRAKITFFSNISHEFRTPLTLMLGPTEDALADQGDLLSPKQRQRIEIVQRNSLRLMKLVNTLLDFSRLESEQLQATYEPTDLATLTAELASSFESAIVQAGLRLVIDCPSLPEPVVIDRAMWEKVVLNLVSNAFKFTFAGEITVRLRLAGSQVELTVQDTGIGIAATELPHLFERFHQAKGTKGRSFEGSGIGLSLVQELVKLQGGTIQVSSVEGEGSCFKVLIPTGLAHLPPEQAGSSQAGSSQSGLLQAAATATGATAYVQEALGWLPESSSEVQALNPELQAQDGKVQPPIAEIQPQDSNIQAQDSNIQPRSSEIQPLNSTIQAQSSNTQDRNSNIQAQDSNIQAQSSNTQARSPTLQALGGKAARILLVDDNIDMRAYLKRQLSQRWQVDTAANGAIALMQIQQHPPDLVLTDVMMPEMDGLQLLRALRANPQTSSIPVILLSALAGEEATIEGLETGADDYLIKPFSVRELMARVETHLQLALLRQEQSTNRFKTEFLLTITHELQSPLALILGWARLLQTKSFDADTMAQALAAIERSATMQAKLVQDLLDVSRIAAGKLRLHLQPTDLESVIKGAIATVTQIAAEAGIDLIWSETAAVVVMGDRERLQQAVCNLLTNAIKFTPQGGRVEVCLSVITSDRSSAADAAQTAPDQQTPDQQPVNRANYAEIWVTDTGSGITPDFLPHLFEQFQQAERATSAKGLGLGLAIARHIVELHNGTIQAQSAGAGQGATFIIRIPLLKPNH